MAIALDTFTSSDSGNVISVTQAHTCTGSNLILWVGIMVYEPTGGDCITGVTYNGVAMTQDSKIACSSTEELYLYYLVNPATGTNNIVVSASTTVDEFYVRAASYTGVAQSSPSIRTSSGPTSATSLTTTLTTTADNSWLVGIYNSNGSDLSAGTNTTARNSSSGKIFCDTNAAQTPAGSKSMQVTGTSSTKTGLMVAIAPYVTPSGPSNLKSLDTNVKANIKSYNTNLIANIKSINTNI